MKVAEKKVRVNPLAPIFGIIIGAGLLGVAVILALAVIDGGTIATLRPFRNPFNPDRNLAIGGIAFGIWLALMTICYMVVMIFAGRDPKSKKGMAMPPRKIKKKSRDVL
jgi:uncharacterized membrane protein YedE/YeeE